MTTAYIFDCDGVLADSEALGLKDTTVYIQSLGVPWTERDMVNLTGLRMDEVSRSFREALEAARGEAISQTEEKKVFDDFVAIRRALKDQLQPVPGALEISRWLSEKQVLRAIASSSQAFYLESKLQRIGLWDHYAPHVYSADLVKEGKPAPDIFLHTAKAIGALPENCIVIEDSVHGVTAGLAAGMTVWGFTGGGHCFEGHGQRLLDAGAHRVIETHDDLQQVIKQQEAV